VLLYNDIFMKKLITFFLLFNCTFFFFHSLLAQPTTPIITLNSRMHTSKISRISTDAQGRYILTASYDKTAKLWDASTGDLIRTYRIPIDKGNEGKLYACALSPDGATVALGGWTGYDWFKQCSIYIFNTQSGTMIKCIPVSPEVISDLEFSTNGNFLAASLLGKYGIRVFSSDTWNLFSSLTEYSNNSDNLCFDYNGRLATVCYDGNVRLYDASFKLIAKTNKLAGSRPYSIAFSPDGKKLAVGFSDTPIVEVLDAKDLSLLYRPDNAEANSVDNRIFTIRFSSDGYLFGGGYLRKQDNDIWWNQIRCWNHSGRGRFTDFNACSNTVQDIKALPDGNMIYCGSYPDFGRISGTGNRLYYKQAQTNDYASNEKSYLKIDYSGTTISFKSRGKDAVRFSIIEKRISPYLSFEGEKIYNDKSSNLVITDWRSSTSPKLSGKNLSFLEEFEASLCVDVSNDRNNIVFGASWHIYCLKSDGEKRWKVPILGSAWAVNVAGNGKSVVVALGDGTIRWFRMSDGKELLALFAHPDNKRWVLWTPSGYYDCSPGAEDFIGWHINNGADHEASYYPASRFRSTYYRPDVINKILETLDEDEALRLATFDINRKSQNTDITRMLPPSVNINYPQYGQEVTSTTISLKYTLQSPNNEPVISIRVYIDGRPSETKKGFKPIGQQNEMTVTIPEKDCKISIIAENKFGFSDPSIVSLVWKGNTVSEDIIKPNLYLVSIGVSDYNDSQLKLQLAAKDARDFASSFNLQKGALYSNVITKVITDKLATKDNILDALDWLQHQTTSRDVAILYLSGHGMNDDAGVFYYLPVNADINSMKRTCLMFADIKATSMSVAGKMLLFIDACHSGDVMGNNHNRKSPDINSLVNELSSAENGVVVFTSSTGKQYSLENSTWGNGAFTKALIEGIGGKADLLQKGKVTVKMLDAYVAERVKELTSGKQSPTAIIPEGIPDFPIAIVK